eukprot:5612053-Karenia_brevis.AAC.1
MREQFPNHSLIFLVDANARPPGPDLHLVGDHVKHRASPSTPRFSQLISLMKIWLPATFSEYIPRRQDVGTYFWHPDKAPVCIDHILVDLSISVSPLSYRTHYIDSYKQALDHLLATLELSLPMSVAQTLPHRRVATCNRRL